MQITDFSEKELIILFENIINERADHYDDWITGLEFVVKALNKCLKERFHSETKFVNVTSILEIIKKVDVY